MSHSEEKKPIYKKWWFWVIIIVIIIAIGGAGESEQSAPTTTLSEGDSSTQNEQTSNASEDTKITLEEFNQIETGMTYEQVVEIIGTEGTVMSESDITGDGQYKTTIYSWQGEGSLGANANITFQTGKVVSKAQFGLE